VERQVARLHGHEICYLSAGDRGPVVVLLHGIAGSADTWGRVIDLLGRQVRVIAPDLLGHGRSAKPRGDYSLGGYANGIRDLLQVLGHERVTLVGHSLGGGVAMQFAYQFPAQTERLALVSSGGLGREVTLLLRAATLPLAEFVIPLGVNSRVRGAVRWLAGLPGVSGLIAPAAAEIGRGFGSFADSGALHAFLHTARGVLDFGGQRIEASDRLYLAAGLPLLIIWGARDRFIPATHAYRAVAHVPGARLEVFERSGHFPHLDEPERFARVLLDFLQTTEPAVLTVEAFRDRLLSRSG
jgi:pimeloyl-ACP methyl ester carboxylesterase